MKKLSALFLFISILFFGEKTILAQAPQKMSYQSVIRNSSNVLLVDTRVRIKISVLQGSATGTPVYVETQTDTTNANGLVSIQIGTGTATTGTFAGINWAAGPYFIKTETDPAGGTNYSITGTQEILSVPYAMYAAKSGDSTRMGAIGGSSSANGGTITSSVLSLAPADATNGGIVTTGTQTFAGNKTLTGTLGVGTTTPAASAQLDLSSTTKGFLPPRMSQTQRNAISTSPSAAGLTIWCTNCGTSGQMQVFNGTAWTDMTGGTALSTTLAIGDYYEGGIVAYILQFGDLGYEANIQHGLIVATLGPNNGIRWYNGSYTTTGAGGGDLRTGLSNTNTIIASQGDIATSYAAGLARAYTGGGYTDWYLPNINELKKLYALDQLPLFYGFFRPGNYWSSTENSQFNAYCHNFITGFSNLNSKEDILYVLAVRAF